MGNLFKKYNVTKNDGSSVDKNAQYFVLRIDTDPAARKAVLRYSSYISEVDPEFANELFNWVMEYEVKNTIYCDHCQTRHVPDCPTIRKTPS
jgi:hypothetical protein